MKPFDATGAFCAAHNRDSLRRAAVRGAGVTVFSQSAGFAIQMIATIVLARLLTPSDFGLVAIVTTFSLLLMNFGLNGFTEAVVQRETIDHSLASNVFWINMAVGLVLTLAFAAAGELMGRVYGDNRVAPVAMAMSATILLGALSGQHLALLKRSLSFSALSANDVLARTVAVTVSIVLGWAGWGYWALVAGAIALPLTSGIGAWVRCRWIPSAPRKGVGTRAMVRFAMNTYGHFAANYCTRNLDNILVGWFFGPHSLGLYKKAYDLCVLPVGQLSEPLHAVAVPTLSRLSGDPERHIRYILRVLSTIALIGMGLSGALTLVGRDLILVLLGPQWAESGRIFSFFAPGIGAMLLYLTYGWIHLSLGRAERLFRWGIVEFVVTALLFLLGLAWGPEGIAAAWVVSFWILTIPALWYAGRPAGLRIAPVVGIVWRSALASAFAAGTTAVMIPLVPSLAIASSLAGLAVRISETCLLFGGLYLTAVIVLHRGRAPLSQFAALFRELLPGRFSGSSSRVAVAVETSPTAAT